MAKHNTESDLKECFDFHDRDADGKVKREEIADIMRSVGHMLTAKEAAAVTAEASGSLVSFSELAEIAKRRPIVKDEQHAQLLKAFRVFDSGETGLIDLSELQHILTSLGDKLTPKEFQDVARIASWPPSGKVDYMKLIEQIAPQK